MGLLKPSEDTVRGIASFVPVFPFMYEKLECGDIIQDKDELISLHIESLKAKQVS